MQGVGHVAWQGGDRAGWQCADQVVEDVGTTSVDHERPAAAG